MRKGFIVVLTLFFLASSLQAQNNRFKRNKKQDSSLTPEEKLNFEVRFFEALRYKSLGNLEAAAEKFQHCVRIDGSQAAPLYELALISLGAKEPEQALFFIESACLISPENNWYKQLLAQVYLSNQKYKKAIQTFQSLLAEQPGNEEWHFQLASAYLYDNQLKNAIKVYDEMEQYVGVDEMLIMQKQRIYMEMGDSRSAIKELQKWQKSEPNNPQPYGVLAELYLLEGNQEKAIEILEEILIIDPQNGKAHLTLSDLYRNKGELESAFEALKKAFSSNLGVDSKMRVLLTYYDLTEADTALREQAFRLLEILAEAHPTDAKPYTIAGDYYYREGNLKKAKSSFEKALEYDKSRFPIWQQLLIISFDLKEYAELVRYASQTTELFPSQPIGYLFAGMANIQLKAYDAAVLALNTGKMMVVGNDELQAQFYASLGDAYHALNEDELSDQSYESSLALSPHNTYVLNNYSYYLSLRKEKLDKALEMMAVCTSLNPGIASYEDTYAWVFYQSGYYEKALEWLKQAMENGGSTSATIVEHFGDVLFQLGQEKTALEQWMKAKSLGSDSKWIDQKIADKKLYE